MKVLVKLNQLNLVIAVKTSYLVIEIVADEVAEKSSEITVTLETQPG